MFYLLLIVLILICFYHVSYTNWLHFSHVVRTFRVNRDFIVIMLYKYMLLISYFMFLNFCFVHSKFERFINSIEYSQNKNIVWG